MKFKYNPITHQFNLVNDALDLGSAFQGVYDALTAYAVGQAVFFNGGLYVCIANSTGQEPSSSPTFWQQLALQGPQGQPGLPGEAGPPGPAGSSADLSTTQLGSLTATHLAALSTTALIGMSAQQAGALTTTWLAGLTATTLASLSQVQLDA
ncbi:MAG: hypothetical protein HQL92_06115, partial [Magnetococcales bacterium]|nr:hypothetical protein [Magnetococcales bacterium]